MNNTFTIVYSYTDLPNMRHIAIRGKSELAAFVQNAIAEQASGAKNARIIVSITAD